MPWQAGHIIGGSLQWSEKSQEGFLRLGCPDLAGWGSGIVVADTQKACYFPLQACHSAVGNQLGLWWWGQWVRAGKNFQA